MTFKTLSSPLLSAVIALTTFTFTATAQSLDEEQMKALIKQELEKLLTEPEFADPIFKSGIERYVNNQKKAQAEAEKARKEALAKNLPPVTDNDHIFGNADAPITLVEYSDFECPFCKRFHPTVEKLVANNPEKVRWVYRHFPLAFHNPGAQKQAEASECIAKVSGNDAFWKYSDLIYKRTKSNGKGFPLDKLKPLAEEIGADVEKFEACYQSGEMTARVENDFADGKRLGIAGTPAAFITNPEGEIRVVSGALPLPKLQAMVDDLSK